MRNRIVGVLCGLGLAIMPAGVWAGPRPVRQVRVETRSKPVLVVDGLKFRDLDGDGKLAPYEDWRRPVDARHFARDRRDAGPVGQGL